MRIVLTSPFSRGARRLAPAQLAALERALRRLQTDPFDPSLRMHKLSGQLAGKWAFSVAHDLRVVCLLEGDSAYLLAIGSHDQVY